jgi:hypothetical protein
MGKLLGGIALLLAIALGWWWFRSSSSRAPAETLPPPRAGASAHAEPPAPHQVRHVAADERQQIASKIEAARKAHAQAPSQPSVSGSTPTLEADRMATPEQVLAEIQALSKGMNTDIEACTKYAPDAQGFKTEISLVGDPDIGTLIDASTPLVGDDGTSLPKPFDDCIRAAFQTLELPPMKTGDAYKVSFEISLK